MGMIVHHVENKQVFKMCMYCEDDDELNFDGTFYSCNGCGETFNRDEIEEEDVQDKRYC